MHTTNSVIQGKNILIAHIEIQIKMAKCFAEHEEYSAFHMKTVTISRAIKLKI